MFKDKDKMLRKLRKINYSDFFGNNFKTVKIDKNLKDL